MVFNIAIHNELLFKIQKPEIMIIFSVSARAGNYRLLVSAEENPFHASLEISLLNCKTEPTLHYYTKKHPEPQPNIKYNCSRILSSSMLTSASVGEQFVS